MLTRRVVIAGFVGFLALLSGGRGGHAQNIESPVEVIEGLEPVTLRYGDHTVGAAVDVIGDIDMYEFFAEAGEWMELSIQNIGLQEMWVGVYGPDGGLLYAFLDGRDAVSFRRDLQLPTRGDYTLQVQELHFDETGGYILQIERDPPSPSRPDLHRLYYGAGRYVDSIDFGCDTDKFVFDGIAGTAVNLFFRSISPLEGRLRIWDNQGFFAERFDGRDAVSFNATFGLPTTGPYHVTISELHMDEVGAYDLNLQCLSGPCPPIDEAVYQIVDAGPNCVDVRLINNVPVRGGELSIGYPSSLVSIKSITALRPGMPTAIEDDEIDFATEILLTGCTADAGVDRGLTINWLDRDGGDVVILPGRQELIRICFTPKAGTTNASCPDLKFLECLGPAPTPVQSLVTDRLGGTVIAQTVDARTCLRVNTPFRRGDVNGDTRYDVSDAISVLICLFLDVGCRSCWLASDANDDNTVDVSDAIYLLQWRFHNGAAPKAPFPNCGSDPTPPTTPAEICVEPACL